MTQQRRKKRQGRSRDPQAEREARRYERPIPSRELILQRLEKHDRPMGFEAIARDLGLREAVDRDALERRLGAMVRDGQLIRNRRDDFCLAERVGVVTGSVIGHRDGFGFLSPEDGGEDVFLSPRQMRSLMHNDRAAVRVRRTRDGRLEGSLVDVLERNTHELVGRYIEEQGIGFVIPDNSRYSQDVLVPAGQRGEARAGQIVEVEIIEQPDRRTQPLGRVIRVLGEHRAPGMEVEIAIASHGLPHGFGSGVHSEVAGLSEQVPEAAKRGREDLRELPLVTIDGADARDFDDAVFCERRGEGWRLIVAIADVSHYVVPDTALDAEARERGTSVYFPDRVIPMLPEVLSNGLCSLNPEVDRLCMACEMQVDARGKVIRSRFLEGVMRSHARLTYDEVAEIVVDGKVEARRRREPLVAHLDHLYELYKVLAGARRRRGAIDFDSVETRIEFGPAPEREVRRIVPLERNDAHKLIEECMIAANVEAARFLKRKRVPTLFRIHEGPDPDKLDDLRDFLGQLGISMGGGDKPQARTYARVLRDIQGREDKRLIETVMLRSLSQAVYSPEDAGHFGLAHDTYLHFTSPIRRYPDLLVHRGIRHILRGGKPREFDYSRPEMERLGHHCSMVERRADEATRDAEAWLKCEFMQDKVGQEFDGVITGVTSFGLFVALAESFVEGLVHVTSLSNDYYQHDAVSHSLIGQRGGLVYRLADHVRVRVVRVDMEERKIDFEMVQGPDRPRGGKGRRRKGRK